MAAEADPSDSAAGSKSSRPANPAPPDSNVGKWDAWYQDLKPDEIGAFRYGDTVTYRIAAAFMADCDEVEDWGCGAGGFKRFYRGRYIGLDGSNTPVADRIVDLCRYSSQVEGIVIRHVLEHNYRWADILDGAVQSFKRKMCLVLFTPFSETTREIAHNQVHGVDVPDLSFSRSDIEARLTDLHWDLFDDIPTESGYGIEHVYLVWRDEAAPPTSALLSQGFRAVTKGIGTAVRRRSRRSSERRAVYTAIFGKYDRLKDIPEGGMRDVDFICFTDDSELSHPQWQVRRVASRYPHPRLDAKYYKAMPHEALPDYDQTLWVDASFQIEHPDFAQDVFEYLIEDEIALFLHPDRGCIYDEAHFCRDMPKYFDQRVVDQVEYYRSQGFPERAGLYAGGVIARRNNSERVQRLNDLWLAENLRWTYQDQLSLPYLLWKLGVKPAVFRQYLWRNQWGSWHAHAHDR